MPWLSSEWKRQRERERREGGGIDGWELKKIGIGETRMKKFIDLKQKKGKNKNIKHKIINN